MHPDEDSVLQPFGYDLCVSSEKGDSERRPAQGHYGDACVKVNHSIWVAKY